MKHPVTGEFPQRNAIYEGDCLRWLRLFPDNSVTAVVTDPPYGLSKQPDMREVLRHWLDGDDYKHKGGGFMSRAWDSFVPGPKVWEEIYRVMKPGAHLLSFSGTRTFDLMLTAMRIAELEVRDKIDVYCSASGYRSWIYGSGFPKSHNLEKALRKKGEDEAADQFAGYGSALKPAHEPIAQFSKANADGSMPESPDAPTFKYQAKASKKDRNSGCEWMFWKVVDGEVVSIDEEEYDALNKENEDHKGEKGFKRHRIMQGNCHVTVKPLELCRYLVRMCKMPGDNLVLDPFCGSGSTLCAAILEGCDYVGIDSDHVAVEISKARTHYFRCLGEAGLK